MTTRRSMLAGLGTAALLGGPARGAFAASTRLRMAWWGGRERADRTNRALEAFTRKHSDIAVAGESMGWSDYWPKLATQVVGRNAPDLIQMDYRYLFEYAVRDTLLPLDKYLSGPLKVGGWDPKFLDVGRTSDGKLYGVNFGANSPALVYSATALKELGLAPPTPDTTWGELAQLGEQVTRKANRTSYYGLCDSGMREPILEIFVRQKGKQLYTPEGKLGFGTDDIREWFALWDEMRKRGACVPADIQALYQNSIESSALSLGKAAMDCPHSNQLIGYQQLNQERLGLTMLPTIDAQAPPGQYLKPSQLLSVYARSRKPEAAVELLNFFVTDPEAGAILSIERGVPIDPAQRAVLKDGQDQKTKDLVEYIDLVAGRVGPLPPPPPKGAGEITLLLRRVNEQIGFGRMAVADGAKQFIAEAEDILSRG
ncbi:ABC transporter substrate-binding protein [Roseomonas sp. E05]|uniref:ABC transporter substrate-binding protein n=1 Tax=Roseomonas sp. E05 TaxID=3046310 RepID=UPI0024B9EDED|nr:ABC transporter substrate-binding protein [Roseomonas sp. E05]MDJ0388851.1 ABC transporter substrate-binding protein [Roseomonas sp. E05]